MGSDVKLLVLSFYYPPDLSAGSFRVGALVNALKASGNADLRIDVVTTTPNRYRTFAQSAADDEDVANLRVRRIQLPAHKSDMLGQSRAFLHFATAALRCTRRERYDLVFATSSRLMTASLGAWIARRAGAPLYLDVRDIFADTMGDVLPGIRGRIVAGIFSKVEAWTMRQACRINLVSRGFEEYFARRYPDRRLRFFSNGIDEEFLQPLPTTASSRADCRSVVLYAGNIGEGQGLHHIVPGLARALSSSARFVIIGDGGRRKQLEEAVAGLHNVELRPPVSRQDLLKAYAEADVLFLHLGDYAAFHKVLPSKIFEYAAMGKPILAGVSGFAARFIRDEVSNAAVFPPCQVAEAVEAFKSLRLVEQQRADFVEKYARRNIMREMAGDVMEAMRAQVTCSG